MREILGDVNCLGMDSTGIGQSSNAQQSINSSDLIEWFKLILLQKFCMHVYKKVSVFSSTPIINTL